MREPSLFVQGGGFCGAVVVAVSLPWSEAVLTVSSFATPRFVYASNLASVSVLGFLLEFSYSDRANGWVVLLSAPGQKIE